MNNEFKRMQKLAGILTEGYQGTDYESSEDMALDMVKTGAGMPGTGLPETKTKMTKSEAKKMIKDAILAEMEEVELNEYDPDQDQLDDEDEIFMPYDDEGRPLEETSREALDRMDGLVDRRVLSSMLYSAGEIIKSLKEEGFEEDEIHDYLVYLVTTLDDSALMEAKKEEEEVEVEDTETVEEPAADEAAIDADMEGGMDLDAGSDEAKSAFDELTDAYRSAKELGDEKLIRQLANTITYFNKNIILK